MIKIYYEFVKRKFLSLLFCHGRVLDVGCGRGSFPNRSLVGVDINRIALTECNYKFKVIADACHLPFRNNSFDVCVESCCIPYAKNWKEILPEMRRVGKKCYLIEQIRNRKRPHWFSLLELNHMGKIVFCVLRTFVLRVS